MHTLTTVHQHRTVAGRGMVFENTVRTALILLIGTFGPAPVQSSPPNFQHQGFTVKMSGTIGFTGKYALNAEQQHRGLKLLEWMVNDESRRPPLFKTASGKMIRMELDIQDDTSDPDEVRRLYTELVERDDAYTFLGPFSSGLSEVAAEVVDGAGKVIMMSSAASPDLYARFSSKAGDAPNVFTVNALAGDYFRDALTQLHKVGARTVLFVQGSSSFHEATCKGAREHAEDLSYTILHREPLSVEVENITISIDKARSLDPDVLVGCGHLSNAVPILLTSRALNFSPKAMLIASAAVPAQSFLDLVGATNANYVLTPVPWSVESASNDTDMAVFNDKWEFVHRFRQMWHSEPDYVAAAAVAAGIAVMSAAELKHKEIATALREDGPDRMSRVRRQIREGLLHMRPVKTVYGTLQFSPVNGTRHGYISVQTVQFVPHDESRGKAVRYTSLRLSHVNVSANRLPKYPIRSWEQKGLAIYPCKLGAVINVSSNDPADCVPCARGEFRSDSLLECMKCLPGMYTDGTGSPQCLLCPEGLNCDVLSTSGKYLAKEGWYYFEGTDVVQPCTPPELCLGNNTCGGMNKGIMCLRCHKSFANHLPVNSGRKGGGECYLCPSAGERAVRFVVLFICYITYTHFVTVSVRKSARSLEAIHVVVMRIFVDYTQTSAIVLAGTSLDWTTQGSITQSFVDLLLDPIEAWVNFGCMFNYVGVEPYFVKFMFGLLFIPFVAVAGLLIILLRLTVYVVIPRYCYCCRRSTEAHARAGVRMKEDEAPMVAQGSLDFHRVLLHDDERRKDHPFEYHDPRAPWPQIWASVRSRTLQALTVWIYIAFPIALRAMLVMTRCTQYDRPRLEYNPELLCFTGEHLNYFMMAAGAVLFYGCGCPILILCILRHVRPKFDETNTRWRYGFLFVGYQKRFYYWEVVRVLRKFCLIVVSTFGDYYYRVGMLLIVLILFTAFHDLKRPFDQRANNIFDHLEKANLACMIMPCVVGFIFRLLKDTDCFICQDSENLTRVSMLLVVGVHAFFLALVVWSIWRNLFLKDWLFIAKLAPHRLSVFKRMALYTMAPRFELLKMNPKTHEIKISHLSAREKAVLHGALCETLHNYMKADAQSHGPLNSAATFYLLVLITALKEAFGHVQRSQAERAKKLVEDEAQEREMDMDLSTHFKKFSYVATTGSDGFDNEDSGRRHSMGRQDMVDGLPSTTSTDSVKAQLALGCTVEELQLALMMSWQDIRKGVRKYFEPEFVRAFEKVNSGTNGKKIWGEDESVNELFREMQFRKRHRESTTQAARGTFRTSQDPLELLGFDDILDQDARGPCEDSALDDEGMTIGDLLGIQRADDHLKEEEVLQQEHAALVATVLELRHKVAQLRTELAAAEAESELERRQETENEVFGWDFIAEEPEEESPTSQDRSDRRATSYDLVDDLSSPESSPLARKRQKKATARLRSPELGTIDEHQTRRSTRVDTDARSWLVDFADSPLAAQDSMQPPTRIPVDDSGDGDAGAASSSSSSAPGSQAASTSPMGCPADVIPNETPKAGARPLLPGIASPHPAAAVLGKIRSV